MSAFKKWWDLNQKTIRHDNETREIAAQAAWAAALDWISKLTWDVDVENLWEVIQYSIAEELKEKLNGDK